MNKNYENQTNPLRRILHGKSGIFVLISMLCLVLLSFTTVQAQTPPTGPFNLTYPSGTSGLCVTDPLTKYNIGLDNSTASWVHVLYRVTLDASYGEKYTRVAYSLNAYGGPIQFGDVDLPGKYISYVYKDGEFNTALINTFSDLNDYWLAPQSYTPLLQTGAFWIIEQPASRTLSFTGTAETDYHALSATEAEFCTSGSVTLTNPEYSPATYGSEWNVTYTLYRNGSAIPFEIDGTTAITPVVNPNTPTIVWNNLPTGTYTVHAQRSPCTAIDFPSPGLEIIVVNAPGVTIDPISDISTVDKTPVVITATVHYPDLSYQQVDNSVLVDALIEFSPQLPAGANIVKLLYNGNPVSMTNAGGIALTDDILLSEIIGTGAYPLNGHSSVNDTWTIVVAGIDAPASPTSYGITLKSVAYVGTYATSFCSTVLATESFTITYGDATVVPIADFNVCSPDAIAFDYNITYPAIANLNTDVKNDAKIEVFASDGGAVRSLNSGTSIAISYGGSPVGTYNLLSAYNTFYLSALLSNTNPPTAATTQSALNDHSGTNLWHFDITGANPGNYFVKITNFAQYDAVEYPYLTESFLLNYIGALGITIDNVTNIATATNAPVIFEAKVNYPQTPGSTIADQNVDPSVLVDALIEFSPALPAQTTIAEIKYNNGAPLTLVSPIIGGLSEVRLSTILGSTPTALLGHSAIPTDTWKISVENLNVAGVYTITMKSVAFVDYPTCKSVMASEDFTVTAADLTIGAISNISSITKTPVIIPVDVQYPAITPYDNTIKVDAKISVVSPTAAFPANTKILGVSIDGGVTNLIVSPYDISTQTSFLLSAVLGSSPVNLIDENGNSYNWEILVMSETTGVINVKVESIVTYPLNVNPFVLASREFSLTYADVTFDAINDITVCHPADVVIEWCETYPLVANVGGNSVLNDTKFTFFADALMTTPLSLPVGTKIKVTTPVLNSWTSTLGTAVNTVYGSAVVAVQSPNPSTNTYGYIKSLERPASVAPACWKVEIIGAPAGTMYVKVEHMALLDWDGTSYFGLTLPFGPHGTFGEYVFKTDDFKVINVGAADVTMDIVPSLIETVTGAPIVVPIHVEFPDLALQNIDPSVLIDARITALTNNVATFPAGSKILDVKYAENGGTLVSVGPASPYTLTGTEAYLSQILGAAYPLANHSNLEVDWEITIVDVDQACTVTTTVQSVAYVTSPYAPVDPGCYSVLDDDSFVATYADIVVTGSAPDTKCAPGTVITEFTLQYPAISANNPSTIDSDAKLEFDNAIPNGTVMTWAINPGSVTPRSYTFTTGLAANTPIKLSEIINNSTGSGLSGTPLDLTIANNLYQAWTLTFTPLNEGFYNLKYTPIATLGSNDDVLITDPVAGITQLITIYEVPNSTITGNANVFSGGVYSYSVAVPSDPLGNSVPGATYSWSASPGGIVTFDNDAVQQPDVTFTWAYPLPSDTVTLTVTVSNGYCNSDPAIPFGITIHPNQLVGQVKYYNAQESPMPSPFMSNHYGMDVPDYFYVSLVDMNFDPELDNPYLDAIEVKKVEEYYAESGPLKAGYDNWHSLLTAYDYYEAAFGFNYNLDPDADYQVIVWDGGYFEESLSDGYLGENWTWNNWGGVNATDALLVQHMTVGGINGGVGSISLPYLSNAPYTNSYAFDVADVNRTNSISSLDALLTQRRAVGLIQKFTNNKPNFAVAGLLVNSVDFNTDNSFGSSLPNIGFDKRNMDDYVWSSLARDHYYMTDETNLGLGNHYLNIYYDAVGDVNASYVPQYGGFKVAPAMELIYENELTVIKGQEITIPVTLDASTDLGALSLGLNYRNDLIEVIGTNYGEDFAAIDHTAGTVRIAWVSQDGARFNQEDAVAMITVRVIGDIEAGTRLFELDGFTELADVNAKVIEGLNFKTSGLNTSIHGAGALRVNNYPNPFESTTTITYTLPVSGNVNLVVYNKLGQIVKTFVDQYQSEGIYTVNVNSSDLNGQGVYYYKLEVKGENGNYSSTNNLVLIK